MPRLSTWLPRHGDRGGALRRARHLARKSSVWLAIWRQSRSGRRPSQSNCHEDPALRGHGRQRSRCSSVTLHHSSSQHLLYRHATNRLTSTRWRRFVRLDQPPQRAAAGIRPRRDAPAAFLPLRPEDHCRSVVPLSEPVDVVRSCTDSPASRWPRQRSPSRSRVGWRRRAGGRGDLRRARPRPARRAHPSGQGPARGGGLGRSAGRRRRTRPFPPPHRPGPAPSAQCHARASPATSGRGRAYSGARADRGRTARSSASATTEWPRRDRAPTGASQAALSKSARLKIDSFQPSYVVRLGRPSQQSGKDTEQGVWALSGMGSTPPPPPVDRDPPDGRSVSRHLHCTQMHPA